MSDYQIVSAMIIYGGGFVQALGHAWRCADSQNQVRIKATWPELFEKYEELAKKAAQAR